MKTLIGAVLLSVASVAHAQVPTDVQQAYEAAELAYSVMQSSEWAADLKLDHCYLSWETALCERDLCFDAFWLSQGDMDKGAGDLWDQDAFMHAASGWEGQQRGNQRWAAALAAENSGQWQSAITNYYWAATEYTAAATQYDNAAEDWGYAIFEYDQATANYIAGQP